MKYLVALSLLLAAPALADEPMRICHFSLNSDEEFRESKVFLDKLNKVSPTPIEVKEFMLSAGADPLLLVHQQSSNTMGSKSMGRVPLEAAIVRAIKLVQQDGRQQALARWIDHTGDDGKPVYLSPLPWFYKYVCKPLGEMITPDERFSSMIYAICIIALYWVIVRHLTHRSR
ncbi:MAG: hypothetical protein EOP11_24345 [Proteobacteria bacterium]|nr:MAG: hypothetical protein EOP11_24345 [Pseudomonadota bacterium]